MRKRRRKKPILHPKHLFIGFSVICLLLCIISFKYADKFSPIKTSLGTVVSPMQNGINSVGRFLSSKVELFQSKEKLLAENKELKNKVDSLNYQNKILAGENVELESYRTLFELDKKYPDYPKVAARVISRDGNNWYNVFTINKGSEEGIQVDYNVIAGNGLVGIVSEVGPHYAKVRSIIDDKSNVSAMFMDTNENCMVKGNLESIYKGYIDVEMISNTSKVKNGAEVVTSQISSKFLPGLLIGYLNDIKEDPSGLTKTAHLTPVVSFDNLDIVLVITQKKDGEVK
ncbi:MAG: rod shape-determining protein MreC [Lachnospiraceae bacterium]|nr:rod shape-determining protein MreC [Lachnospiraceae bacterium]